MTIKKRLRDLVKYRDSNFGRNYMTTYAVFDKRFALSTVSWSVRQKMNGKREVFDNDIWWIQSIEQIHATHRNYIKKATIK